LVVLLCLTRSRCLYFALVRARTTRARTHANTRTDPPAKICLASNRNRATGRQPTYQSTLLHEMVCHSGADGLLAASLDLGADPSCVDIFGETPLHKLAKATGTSEQEKMRCVCAVACVAAHFPQPPVHVRVLAFQPALATCMADPFSRLFFRLAFFGTIFLPPPIRSVTLPVMQKCARTVVVGLGVRRHTVIAAAQ
jgi:hypothetical protein